MTPFLTSVFRHAITALAGIIIHASWASGSHGYTVTGVLVLLFGIALSWIHKAAVAWKLDRLELMQRLARVGGDAAFLGDRDREAIAREVEGRNTESAERKIVPFPTTTTAALFAIALLLTTSGCATPDPATSKFSFDMPTPSGVRHVNVETPKKYRIKRLSIETSSGERIVVDDLSSDVDQNAVEAAVINQQTQQQTIQGFVGVVDKLADASKDFAKGYAKSQGMPSELLGTSMVIRPSTTSNSAPKSTILPYDPAPILPSGGSTPLNIGREDDDSRSWSPKRVEVK